MVTSLPVSDTVKPQICIDNEIGIYKKSLFLNEFIGFKVLTKDLAGIQSMTLSMTRENVDDGKYNILVTNLGCPQQITSLRLVVYEDKDDTLTVTTLLTKFTIPGFLRCTYMERILHFKLTVEIRD